MSNNQEQQGHGDRDAAQPAPPFWRNPAFCAMFCDPFIEGSPLQRSHVVLCLAALAEAGARLVARGRALPQLRAALDVVRGGLEVAGAVAQAAEEAAQRDSLAPVERALGEAVVARIGALAPGALLLVPCGWHSVRGTGTVVLLVERGAAEGSVVVCNSGVGGLDYHPARCAAGGAKIKYKTCLRLAHIADARLTDPAFWTIAQTLWAKGAASEYSREEVLYDVLLPWLVEPRTVDEALRETAASDTCAVYRTPRRAETSALGSCLEALCYVLARAGVAQTDIARTRFALADELLRMAVQPLAQLCLNTTATTTTTVPVREVQTLQLETDPRGAQHNKMYAEETVPQELTPTDLWVLRKAASVYGAKAANAHDKQRITDEELRASCRLAETCRAVVDAAEALRPCSQLLRTGDNLPDSVDVPQTPQPRLAFTQAGLLEFADASKYAGSDRLPQRRLAADFLALPHTITTSAQALSALTGCAAVCESLLQMCRESSTSSRLALQYEGIELVNSLFLELLPVPAPCTADDDYTCAWLEDTELDSARRTRMLASLYELAHVYATMWQPMEHPTREADSRRALVAGCMLCVCDALLRTSLTTEDPMPLGAMLWEDEGYALSTTVCTDNRPYETLSAQFELVRPRDQAVRDHVLAYMDALHRACANTIFEFHQVQRIELNKYSGTMRFLRSVLERFGYPLIPPHVHPVPTEMEALTDWLVGEHSQLVAEHPEFGHVRDIVFLFKYLTTMETRTTAMLRRRNQETDAWRLSFDDEEGSRFSRSLRFGGMAAGADFHFEPITWQILNFRGAEMHIADVSARGFGDAELSFGESPVTTSPADIALLAPDLHAEHPSEDDVIHATALPSFGGTLSREESEALLSFLTVGYTRIPLVLGFFAAHDRATYLFDTRLRALLQAVLFEPGPWVPTFRALKQVDEVPLRQCDLQHRENVLAAMTDARIELRSPDSALGTATGLLLNELLHSPEATLRPLHSIVARVVQDLSNSPVHSSDATCVLALVTLVTDTDAYILEALRIKQQDVQAQETANAALPETERRPIDDRVRPVLRHYHQLLNELLQTAVEPLFTRWIAEAEAEGDVVTACVVHGYRALLWTNMQPNEISPDSFSKLFGSLAYVRNWHGFGMGQNRSDLVWTAEETSAVGSARDRLCRFLQAYGIDTRKISPAVIDKYVSSAATKPLFLHVAGQVVRCPRLASRGLAMNELGAASSGENEENNDSETVRVARVPPADVPESRLFQLLQCQRAPLVFWLESVPQDTLDRSLIACVQTALRDKHFATPGWRRLSSGRFFAERAEVTVDIQTGEILWRNNQLKPVPDSMTQYYDFENIFGREPLHCGLVTRNAHRLWVHVVGTEYDLQEWDAPNPRNQGLGVPTVIPPPQAKDPKTDIDAALAAAASLFVCSKCGRIGNACWACPVCTFVNCSGPSGTSPSTECELCHQHNPNHKEPSPDEEPDKTIKEPPKIDPEHALYEGIEYTRTLNLYQQKPHDQPAEQWVVDTLKPVIQAIFPPQKPLPYPLLLPKEPLGPDCDECHLIGCEDADKDTATWREFVVYRRTSGGNTTSYFEVFVLVSHGRRMWRSLVFTSNTLFSLHSMQPLATATDAPLPTALLHAAGDLKKKRTPAGSLVILRINMRTRAKEYYIPPRLLQGVVPDAILECYRFWQNDKNGTIVGEVLDTVAQDSSAAGTSILVELGHGTRAAITRNRDNIGGTLSTSSFYLTNALERSSSSQLNLVAPETEESAEDKLASQLTALGFSMHACKLALEKNHMDMSMAASWLLDDSNATEIMLADVSAAVEASKACTEEQRKQQLLSQGYPQNSVNYALRLFDGNPEQAQDWLDNPENQTQIRTLDPCQEPTSPEHTQPPFKKLHSLATSAVLEFPSEHASAAPATDVAAARSLLDVRSTELFDLCRLLSRVEDMSHVLVWGSRAASATAAAAAATSLDDQSCVIQSVELPRLKLRFHIDTSSGSARLSLSDHEGWFVSERACKAKQTPDNDFFVALLQALPHSLVLENDAQQYRVLVPNHDPFCPVLAENPYSDVLVFDRGSMTWKEAMDVPVFMYTVHPSRTFLVGPTLSSRLYLALLHMLTHNYRAAFELLESCTVDTAFTADEKHVFEQFARTLRDRSPDAHACRLKLVLSVLYSRERAEWETLPEIDGYLRKLPHVSRACRLTAAEELDVLHSCKSGNALAKARHEYLMHPSASDVVLQPPLPKLAGMPWMKLQSLSGEYIASHGKNVKVMKYERPEGGRYEGVKFLEVIWDHHLLMDDASGTTRSLGFCFLYNVLRHVTPVLLFGGRDCTQSVGELLTRWFQLKQCRWGKDAVVGEGETETELLLEVVLLCAMAGDGARRMQNLPPVAPLESLPAIPTDRRTTMFLSQGIHFFGKQAKDTAVKTWFDALLAITRAIAASPQHADSAARCLAAQQGAHDHPLSMPCTVHVVQRNRLDDRPSGGNTGCGERVLHAGTDVDDKNLFAAYCSAPLCVLCGEDIVEWRKDSETVPEEMPFSVAFHAAARPSVAQSMVTRMADDLKLHAQTSSTSTVPVLHGLAPSDVEVLVRESLSGNTAMQEAAAAMIRRVVSVLKTVEATETQAVANAARAVVADANTVALAPGAADETGRLKFVMRRCAGLECDVTLDYLSRLVVSTTAEQDLVGCNPFLGSSHSASLASRVCVLMLRTSRASQAKRALHQCTVLLKLLSQAASGTDDARALCDKINFACSALAEQLTARRHYTHVDSDGVRASFDPRYLIFEYVFDIMLRERQVRIVEDFVASCRSGGSRVQQMIMGAGKTTVVGPLLSLILADGDSLVMQVMPTALLEQTRNILRNCFSTIIKKQIFTLEFDRGVEDGTEAVAEKYAKLRTACTGRGVVCAAPETIKSLMLKFVEQSHAIESFDFSLLTPDSDSTRDMRGLSRLRDAMVARSEMADALVKILDLWKRSILIMDEVDVLLHPLRSELNFPIGDKQAIDLAGFRWDLPIHIIDAVFYAAAAPGHKRLVCGPEQYARLSAAGRKPGVEIDADAVLRSMEAVISKGYEEHMLQAVPHLVLLDTQFYEREMKPLVAQWTMLWLLTHFVGEDEARDDKAWVAVLLEYIMGHDTAAKKSVVEAALMPDSLKLLNLAQDWVCRLLPHVLSKIDRVSYGLLSAAELAAADPRTPQSRLLMAIPFVGKDVPSRSSEFAHPDAVIGLSVLAYRYEGLRQSDVLRLITQLKQDYSRQVGPRDQRPASVLLASWLRAAAESGSGNGDGDGDGVAAGLAASVLPLALLQPADKKQLTQLHVLLRKVPEVICYYLCQHVFPACMSFQQFKMSACGHELGSDILFGRRIGFSGTPSNLLPLDLGTCHYEPCSDGRILSVLTSPKVVTATVKSRWDARSILRDICDTNRQAGLGCGSAATPVRPIHALIDTGALITGMDNEEVADYLVRRLPEWMEGVVYLDADDRQMVRLRGTGVSVQLAQCGIPPERRFTFYDQVHTTGMDIKQFSSARAVLTVGKDMTFRDYAQGAYRMRGIGRGMTVDLCIIPEVRTRIASELGTHATGRYELDIPAWLLINSMRMETLQFVKMGTQELMNTWRKRALGALLDEVHTHRTPHSLEMQRLHRFDSKELTPAESAWLRRCVALFREPVSYTVPSDVPVAVPYSARLQEITRTYAAFTGSDSVLQERVAAIVQQLTEAMGAQQQQDEHQDGDAHGLELCAEVVHEQEAQEEQEAEEEAEEEEQKMSQFSRDDEQQNPWPVTTLSAVPGGELRDTFYRLSLFHVKTQQPCLTFPANMLVSDNFFRPAWLAMGPRRLKNAHVFVVWNPRAGQELLDVQLPLFCKQLTTGCGNPQCTHSLCASSEAGRQLIATLFAGTTTTTATAVEAAARKVLWASTVPFADPRQCAMYFCPGTCAAIEQELSRRMSCNADGTTPLYAVALSLAEAETLRLMLHRGHPVLTDAAVTIYDVDAQPLDASPNSRTGPALAQQMSTCLKFLNCEMYYSDDELALLDKTFASCPYAARVAFFNECLGVRSRERHLWGDTPVARLFAPRDEWQQLAVRVLLEQARAAIVHVVRHKATDPYAVYTRLAVEPTDGITYEQFEHYFEAMHLGFSPANCYEIAKHIDTTHTGRITMAQIAHALSLPSAADVQQTLHQQSIRRQLREAARGVKMGFWKCKVCTFVNSGDNTTCAVCDSDWTGHRGCPADKWVCAADKGGCTYFNPKTLFYCEMCGRARPDLSSVRLL